jgi:hypothetical protein
MKLNISNQEKTNLKSEVSITLSEIKKLHSEILDAARTSLDKAIRIGEILVGIKAGTKHGDWLPWLKSNAPFSQQTASNYMRLHGERDRLKLTNVGNLSEAYDLLENRSSRDLSRTPAHSDADNDFLVSVTAEICSRRDIPFTVEDVLKFRNKLAA